MTRAALWNMINPTELGFRPPKLPARKAGDPPVDADREWDQATATFLTNNMERIKIRRYVR